MFYITKDNPDGSMEKAQKLPAQKKELSKNLTKLFGSKAMNIMLLKH